MYWCAAGEVLKIRAARSQERYRFNKTVVQTVLSPAKGPDWLLVVRKQTVSLGQHQIQRCSKNAAIHLLFRTSWTPAAGHSNRHRLPWRLRLWLAQLFGSSESPSRSSLSPGKLDTTANTGNQNNSTSHNGSSYVNYAKLPAAQPCRVLTQRLIWCE